MMPHRAPDTRLRCTAARNTATIRATGARTAERHSTARTAPRGSTTEPRRAAPRRAAPCRAARLQAPHAPHATHRKHHSCAWSAVPPSSATDRTKHVSCPSWLRTPRAIPKPKATPRNPQRLHFLPDPPCLRQYALIGGRKRPAVLRGVRPTWKTSAHGAVQLTPIGLC